MTPQQHLEKIGARFPGAWSHVDMFRQSRGVDLPEWPSWCFMPMAAWVAIATQGQNNPLLGAMSAAPLSALGTWRYSQGVYRFDADTYAALADTVVSGALPVEVLYRLPEWCIYIETPDSNWAGDKLFGFWAHLEWDANTERHELRLLLNCGELLLPIPVHLGPWTITEAVDRAASEAVLQSRKAGLGLSSQSIPVERIGADINRLISLLLYICSDEPEIDDEREPGSSPARPSAVKTKRGWKMFPAKKPRVWTVGGDTGAQLREARELQEQSDGSRTVEPHIRRAHWHGFWSGPRDGKRKFHYKWLPPIFVQGRRRND